MATAITRMGLSGFTMGVVQQPNQPPIVQRPRRILTVVTGP